MFTAHENKALHATRDELSEHMFTVISRAHSSQPGALSALPLYLAK